MDFIMAHHSFIQLAIGLTISAFVYYVAYVMYREKKYNVKIRRSPWVFLGLIVAGLCGAFMIGVLASHYGQP